MLDEGPIDFVVEVLDIKGLLDLQTGLFGWSAGVTGSSFRRIGHKEWWWRIDVQDIGESQIEC